MIRNQILAAVALVALTACQPGATAPAPPAAPAPTSTAAPTTTSTPPAATTSAPATDAAPTSPPPPTSTAPAPDTRQVEITWYGSYDNDPKGSAAIDSPVLHQTAGGTGTYADPLTFASPVGADGSMAYGVGARIYVPSVRKYFIREDSCAISWTAPNGCGALTHVDLYIGNPSGTKDVLKCEDTLTPDGLAPIVLNPAADLPVDTTPLWTQASKSCHVLKK